MAASRFAGLAGEVLRAAGWFEGRDIGPEAEEMAARTVAAAREANEKLEAFPVVLAALHEFGGLTVSAQRAGISFPGNDMRIDPTGIARNFGRYAELAEITRTPCFPFAVDLTEPGTIALDAEGRVFLLHHATGFYLAGQTVDEGLTALIEQAGPLTGIFDVFDEPEW